MGNANSRTIERQPLIQRFTCDATHKGLTRVFHFLDKDSLKTCRIVCHKWKYVAEEVMMKKSRILIEFRYYGDKTVLKALKTNFHTAFPTSIDKTTVAITSFKLKGAIPLSPSELEDFFKVRKQVCTELVFQNVNIRDLRNYNIKKFIGPHITRLEIHDDRQVRRTSGIIVTRLAVPLHLFTSIEFLSLQKCWIILGENRFFISPKHAKFESVTFFCKKKQLQNIVLNDFIDFHQIIDLALWGEGMILDMSDSITMNSLIVTNAPDWEKSLWNVNKLILYSTSFIKNTQMTIRHFESRNGQIDLSMLPPTIEKLILVNNVQVYCSLPAIFLPNLKYLAYLSNESYENLFPEVISTCHNLVELILGSDSRLEKFDLNFLPKSIKKLRLEGEVRELSERNADFKLDVLTLIHWSLESIKNNLHAFPAASQTLLTFGYDSMFCGITAEANVKKVLEILQKCSGSISLGSFWINEKDFPESCIMPHVDKNAKYYRFENGNGVAIENRKFYDLISLKLEQNDELPFRFNCY